MYYHFILCPLNPPTRRGFRGTFRSLIRSEIERRLGEIRIFYLQPITKEALVERLSSEVQGKILNLERTSSRHEKRLYGIKSELDKRYLERARKIINNVGDYIGDYLPRFFSPQRSIFDYVRKHKVEFLSEYKLFEEVRVRTLKKATISK